MEHYLVRSSKLGRKLYLTKVQLSNRNVTKVTESTNHVFCCDVSGSMYNTLPKMRSQLKSRIPDIVSNDDTITIIAFSGHNQCAVLKELVSVKNLNDLSALNKAIDKFLVPMGLTCFLDPIEYTNNLISKNPGLWSFIFLSDGGHNECPWENVVNELSILNNRVSNAVIIEYGYYADSEKLSTMASSLGGTKIVAADFDSYEPVIESALSSKSSPKVKVSIDVPAMFNRFIYLNEDNKTINVTLSQDGELLIPEEVTEIFCLTEEQVGEKLDKSYNFGLQANYAMAYVCANELQYKITETILESIADLKFIELYCNSYGKQRLFEFQDELLKATFDFRYRGNILRGYKPNSKAYCVYDVMKDLMNGNNRIYVLSSSFNYNRTSAKTVVKRELTDEESRKLSQAKTKHQAQKVQEEIDNNSVKVSLVNKGYPVNNFVWNEDRANLSGQFVIDATIDLPKNNFGLTKVDSFVFRNFTIIKDSILNVNKLPVDIDSTTFHKINKKNPNIFEYEDSAYFGSDGTMRAIINLANLPIINRRYARSIKCSKMTELVYELTEVKFALKYLGYLKKQIPTTKSDIQESKYTKEQIEYLESLGITEKNGYSPKTELDKTGDFYMALTFKTVFDGFSSIPKIETVLSKRASNKKFTTAETFMNNIMNGIDSNLKCYNNYEDAVNEYYNNYSKDKKKLSLELSAIKFAMILTRSWFNDRKDFTDNQDQITDDYGNVLTITYRFTETKQSI